MSWLPGDGGFYEEQSWDSYGWGEEMECNAGGFYPGNASSTYYTTKNVRAQGETEKAYLVEYKSISFWLPKSVVKGKVTCENGWTIILVHKGIFKSNYKEAKRIKRGK